MQINNNNNISFNGVIFTHIKVNGKICHDKKNVEEGMKIVSKILSSKDPKNFAYIELINSFKKVCTDYKNLAKFGIERDSRFGDYNIGYLFTGNHAETLSCKLKETRKNSYLINKHVIPFVDKCIKNPDARLRNENGKQHIYTFYFKAKENGGKMEIDSTVPPKFYVNYEA